MNIYFLSSDIFYLNGLAHAIEFSSLRENIRYININSEEELIAQMNIIESDVKSNDIVIFDFENVDYINLCTESALRCTFKALFVIDQSLRDGYFFYNNTCFLSKKSTLSLVSFLIMKVTLFNKDYPVPLTIREQMILSLLSQGVEQREIAGLLNVSNQSISRYKSTIENKIGLMDCNSFLFMKYSRILTQLNSNGLATERNQI